MALKGLHVAFGYIGGQGPGYAIIPILINSTTVSHTMASAGVSTAAAGAESFEIGTPVASVTCDIDAWVAFGKNPDAASAERRFLRAGGTQHFLVRPGDRVAWAPATLQGLHVAFGHACARGPGGVGVVVLHRNATGGSLLTKAGVSDAVAPPGSIALGSPIAQIVTTVDAWIAIGPNPDASKNPRRFMAAHEHTVSSWGNVAVQPGDRVAWMPA